GNLYAINWSAPAGLSELRTVFFSMSFNFLKDPGDQAQVTYRVLLWLAGIQKKLGRDLAISDYTITPPAPRYQQDVTLNVTVRNNGDQAETGFQVLFTDVFLGVETTIGAPLTVGTLGPFGESVWVVQNWRPDKVGLHILRAKVDWNNKIPETNENNNEVSNLLFSGEVFVGYNILVVDDDNQDGATIGLATYNSTQAILDDFAEINLGLARPVLEYDYFHVPLGLDGPPLATMQRYNAVVWNTGTATPSGASFLLTANDRQAIQDYLRSSGGGSMFYLIAPNLADEIALQAGGVQIAYNNFMRDNFGVGDMLNSSDPAAAGVPGANFGMYGTLNDDVSHGMLASFNAARGNGAVVGGAARRTSLAGGAGNFGLFHADAGDDYWTISTAKYYGTRRYDSTFNFRAAWLGFSPAYLTNGSAQVPRSEVSYMVLHWMGVPDPRGNAKITPPDIFVSAIGTQLNDEHLEIQRSYILKIQVRNTGQKVLNGLAVRYLDSGTIIATESASVGASSVASNWQVNDGRVVVEAIWTPLFAGVEDIEVVIDPDNIIAERTKLDNSARQFSQVFFFYDDLESGEGKWKHEGTIARINGENALDFIPLGVKAETDIRGTFQYSDYSATAGVQPGVRLVQNFSDWSHSDPNSFWFAEAPPKPLDIVFVIDRTGSMGFSSSGTGLPCDGLTGINSCKWQQTKAAYFSFLDKMKVDNTKHRSALITFSASTGGDTNPGRVDLRSYFGYGASGIFLDRGLTSDITLLKAAFNLTSPT
ncbi:MAG TPA: CARDB domain-containing protein, partial [Thermoplasmata archaeon]|nr:CARDB domain-containing protein [Thermoplasmata archaeon]